MRLPRFEYFAPKSLPEALTLLEEKTDGVHVMAGGTDMMVKMSHGRLTPKTIVNIKEIPDLRYIRFSPDKGLEIGSTALLSDVLKDSYINAYYPALIQAVQTMANTEVRNMATLAGNLCNAAPSADSAPPLMVMGAQISLLSAKGERRLPLMDFFQGPGITVKAPTEIMTAIHVPSPQSNSGASYKRISARCGVDIAAVGSGAWVKIEANKFTGARIVLGAVAPVPLRAVETEAALIGAPFNDETVINAARIASNEAKPISDVRATAHYRKRMVEVMTKRAIFEACERSHARQS